ncbi:hypothetical protein [Halomonas organivorans]
MKDKLLGSDFSFFDGLNYDLLASVFIAVLGYCLVHAFTSWRDRVNKRREIRAEFLNRSYDQVAKIVTA